MVGGDKMSNLISNIIPQVGGMGSEDPVLSNPSFTYTLGLLTRIDYEGGEYKTLSYAGSQLTTVVFHNGTDTTTKTLSYNVDGTLSSITET